MYLPTYLYVPTYLYYRIYYIGLPSNENVVIIGYNDLSTVYMHVVTNNEHAI